ncbi:MAG: hypothetical protein ACYDBB_11025 [Armatimonadota bacterium]
MSHYSPLSLRLLMVLPLLLITIVGCLADTNAFLELLPSLKTMPAPPGAVEGLRIVYYSSAATVPGVYHSYHVDEQGNWVDDKGNRYRRESEPGSGGHGYTQVDVATLSTKGAVLHVVSWGLQQSMGKQIVVPIGVAGHVSSTPAAGGDYWLHPTALKSAPAKSSGNVKILNMPYKIGNKTFQAVRFQYEAENSRMVYVFDRQTGLLLHSNSMVKNDIRTMLTQNTLVDAREVKYPWAKAASPGWLSSVKSISGSGSYTVAIPYSPPMSVPMKVAMQMQARGDRWVRYRQTAVAVMPAGVPSSPEVRELVSGSAQCGGIWLPPAGLTGLKSGQVIDTDPTTGIKLSVANAAALVDGRSAVIITEAGSGHTANYAYDKESGMLIHFTQQTPALNTTIDVALRR